MREGFFVWFLPLALIAGLVTFLVFMLTEINDRDRRLFRQCIADGYKEYQCRAMIMGHGNYTTIPMHIVIPRDSRD